MSGLPDENFLSPLCVCHDKEYVSYFLAKIFESFWVNSHNTFKSQFRYSCIKKQSRTSGLTKDLPKHIAHNCLPLVLTRGEFLAHRKLDSY